MQSHTQPSAHVCTTLPPGNLPMRDLYQNIDLPTTLVTVSQCGRVKMSFDRQFEAKYPAVPIGTWAVYETRTDDDGEAWLRQDRNIHYVVDDFGFLARARHEGGAA